MSYHNVHRYEDALPEMDHAGSPIGIAKTKRENTAVPYGTYMPATKIFRLASKPCEADVDKMHAEAGRGVN